MPDQKPRQRWRRRLAVRSRQRQWRRQLQFRVAGGRARAKVIVLDLTPIEFRMLKLFASAPGRMHSRDPLLSTIYLDGRIVGDRTVDSHVKNLSRKLRPVFGDEEVIQSICGVGYKFD